MASTRIDRPAFSDQGVPSERMEKLLCKFAGRCNTARLPKTGGDCLRATDADAHADSASRLVLVLINPFMPRTFTT